MAQELERVGERQVPPELDALAEHHADAPGQLDALARRLEAGYRDTAGRRHEDARQHLHRRRLAGAVRADVADERAGLDLEADVVDRAYDRAFAQDAAALPPQ